MTSRRRPSNRRKPKQAEREETLTVQRIGARGDAVLNSAAGPVFAPGLLPGETAKLAIRGERGRVIERVTASDERVEPGCSVADQCGGCSLQHWRKEDYRAWKRSLVVEALGRAGLQPEVGELIEAWGEGRRRAHFHALRLPGRGDLVFGYAERAGAHLVDINDCPVAAPAIRRAIPLLRSLAGAIAAKPRSAIDLAVTATDAGLDVAVSGAGAPGLAEREAAAGAVRRGGWARITIEGEPVAEVAAPAIRFGRAAATPPPGGFLQATAAGEQVLADLVLQACPQKPSRIIDLFAGSGAFALRLAERGPVLAVEGDEASSAALRRAADRTPGLKPVQSLWRDLALEPLTAKELDGAELVVIDPPRAGARAQAEALAFSSVPTIVSISCNPATFARDSASLIEGGYRMGPVSVIDQFAWTGHVECAAVFTRA
ncbi:MAG: class I SAM-dependent RNA methyltransferase [Pseudomonadota bacterium]